eukprot:gene25458-13384_t
MCIFCTGPPPEQPFRKDGSKAPSQEIVDAITAEAKELMHKYEALGEEGVEDLSYRKRLNLASELDEVAFKLHTWSDHALAAMLAGAGAVVMEEVDEDSPIEASALKTTIESRLKAYQLLEIVSTQDDAIAVMPAPRRAHCAAQLYGRLYSTVRVTPTNQDTAEKVLAAFVNSGPGCHFF